MYPVVQVFSCKNIQKLNAEILKLKSSFLLNSRIFLKKLKNCHVYLVPMMSSDQISAKNSRVLFKISILQHFEAQPVLHECTKSPRSNHEMLYFFSCLDIWAVVFTKMFSTNWPKVVQKFCSQPGHLSCNQATLFLKTVLANKPSTMQIFPNLKFGINQTTGSKVM